MENVGYKERNNNLFEMIGNFQLGEYLKEDEIRFEWKMIKRELGIKKEKIIVKV